MVLNSPSVIRPEARASWSCASLEAKEGTGVGGKCTGWPVDAGVAGGGGSDAKGVAGGGASDSMGGDGDGAAAGGGAASHLAAPCSLVIRVGLTALARTTAEGAFNTMLLRPTLTFLMVGRAGVDGSLETAARTSRVLFDGDLPLVSPAETFGSMDGAFSLPTGITGARRLPSGTTLEMMFYNRSGGVGKGVRGSTWYNGLFLTSYIYKV